MPMPPQNEGLRSEPLRATLKSALAGKTAALEDLLCRHGGGHDARPNFRLAAAFGTEMAAAPGEAAARLLSKLGADDSAPDTPRVFLPIAAVYGWVGRLRAGRDDVETAWAALPELTSDERLPVRRGALDALTAFAAGAGGADALVRRADGWLEVEDSELAFAAAALVVEVFADRRALAALSDPGALLDYLSRVLALAAGAARSAERSDARRRLLLALPATLAAVVAGVSAGARGLRWLEGACTEARRPDVREALSNAILRLGSRAQGPGAVVAQRLRAALEGSAKPPRDPTRARPGVKRGKASRPMR